MKTVLFGVYALIICAAVFAIIKIRDRHFAAGSSIEEAQNRDFITDISQYKQKKLASQPWNMKYETYTAIGTICAILFSVVGYLFSGMPYCVFGALVGFLVPEAIVRIQAASQKQKFEERYARSLRQLSAGLKSGQSLHQAIEDVCHSPFVHDDIRKEFQQLTADLKLGVSLEDAFHRFADHVGCADAEDVAIAISMQSKVGGQEGAVIETIAKNISDRMMLRKEVNSMFAGSSVTVTILDIVPFAIVLFLIFGASEFMGIYFRSTTMFILFLAMLALMGIGSIVTHSMIQKMKRECGVQ